VKSLQDGTLKNKNSGFVGDNAQASGDIAGRDIKHNSVNIFGIFKSYQKSEIFEVVKLLDRNAATFYLLDDINDVNPDWNYKMDFNMLDTWKNIFFNCDIRLKNFEDQIITRLRFPDKLLNSLKNQWIQVAKMEISSDDKCNQIKDKLLAIVEKGKSHRISEESKEDGVFLTMYWAFTRCQIMENPPQEYNS